MIIKFTYTFLLFLYSSSLLSQNEFSKEKHYTVYDSIIGIESLNLLNGKLFIDYFKSNKEEHRYFQSFQYYNGLVVSEGQPYFNLSLKYDLLEDQLILNPNTEKNFLNIKLISENISRFTIANHEFFNFYNNDKLKKIGFNGFLEPVYKGNLINLYSKHSKDKKEKIRGNKTYFIFNKYAIYLLQYNTDFYEIKSRKSLRKIFPEMETLINEYYKKNTVLLKRNPNQFYKLLINQIDNQL
ncbi:hypothetical protein FG167_13045 [Lacinutrix sp. WUR7]|uniref:hypothetical protein n=1 Tax=Lacinutrix sp. WUR7 TaxID=2653681 RepID=UPI00193DE32D|nr:hypothetical protein [Lacinutrix sp. WUR7]QRM90120.1 hypothetical protein FG167_13045 [Lacinutrix sp. WUR7]